MKKIIKITDVAEKAGVVKSTVSNVLSGKKFVSEELKKKVLDACEELGYHPNFYAAALSSHKSNIIALLLESNEEINNKLYQKLIVSCVKQASKSGYSLLIYYNSDKEELLNTLRQGAAPIDGAVLMTPCVNDERFNQIKSGMISCVVIGRPENDLKINYVDINNIKLVKDVTEKLISDFGTDVYLINSESHLTISQDRAKAFKEVCEKYGIDALNHTFESVHSNEDEGYAISKPIMRRGGIYITANGKLAAGVYRCAKENNLKIGEDIAVFALGRALEHGLFEPKLSYADQDYELLGSAAVEMLIDEIENGYKKRRILVDSKIIYTQSVEKNRNNC